MRQEKIKYNADEKFDIQLSAALIAERRLGHILEHCKIEKIELKTESWQWERTGNICIEYMRDDKMSCIGVTQADWWSHELVRGDETLGYFWFPVPRLKRLVLEAIHKGDWRIGGDGHRQHVALLRLRDLLR